MEKKAFPEGWKDAHYIQANTDLEYELHFHNDGADTLFTLGLRDTLDFLRLDPGSVTAGPASHPYQLNISGTGVLDFHFPQVMLGAGARVWVKFRVRQQKDLPSGTVIRNRAWAYPGFSAPVATNETFHTVVSMLPTGVKPPATVEAGMKIWPAPSAGEVHIEVSDIADYLCRIVDINGRLILEKEFYGKELMVADGVLPRGIFLVNLYRGGRKLACAPLLKY